MSKIKGLVFRGELLGLRFYLQQGVFDLSNYTLALDFELTHYNIEDKITLVESEELLVSQEELTCDVVVSELTPTAIDEISSLLETEEVKTLLKGYQPPHLMSTQNFIQDSGWRPVRVTRTDEHDGQHEMLQPDGTKWSGGWVGKGRTPEIVKRNFHYDQVKYKIHWGVEVADSALDDYPDLKSARDGIQNLLALLSSQADGELTAPTNDGETYTFPMSAFPESRYSQRAFVANHNLSPSPFSLGVTLTATPESWFTPNECMCIAISMKIAEITKQPVQS